MARKRYDLFDQVDQEVMQNYNEDGEWVARDQFGRTRSELMVEAIGRANELDSVASVYETADKIISGDSISVTIVSDPEMDTTAKNNGREIIYNANLIENLDSETITSLHGTNYHELAHILFSPRAGSALGDKIKKAGMIRAFNMLEEARIEKLMIAKYPSTRLFLEAMTLEYTLKGDSKDWADLFPILTGRKYIDLEIRQAVADKFVAEYGEDTAREIHAIVNEYRTLVFPKDFDRAHELIARFSEIVGKDYETPSKTPKDGQGGCEFGEPRPILTKGKPANGKDQEVLQSKAGAGEKSNEKLDSKKIGAGAGGESTVLINENKEYTAEDSALADKVNERMAEIRADRNLQREVRETRNAITGSDDMRSIIPNAPYEDKSPSESAVIYARKFGQELERLVRNNDPYWDKRLPSGKLNIGRTMTNDVNAISEMFDLWDIGNENNEIESVVLLDNSGSMGYHMKEVCQSAWIIKRGLENIDSTVSVYSFDHESKKVYARGEKAKPRSYRHVMARGSTNPLRALVEAERTFHASEKPIKVLFVVTDGEWDSETECNEVIERLNKLGVLTSIVFMTDYSHYSHILKTSREADGHYARQYLARMNHGVKVFRAISTPRDILKVADDLVKSTLTRKVA